MRRAAIITAIGVATVVAVLLLFAYAFPWVDRTFVSDPVLGAVLRP